MSRLVRDISVRETLKRFPPFGLSLPKPVLWLFDDDL